MNEPEWILKATVLGLHEQSIREHGGTVGIRDAGLNESALGKPANLFAYGSPSLFDLAASYAFGIIKNHPYLDGNKRTGFVTAILLLELNGYRFEAEEDDAAIQTLALAAGEITEPQYAAWLEAQSVKTGASS